jgi:hypothetical protein
MSVFIDPPNPRKPANQVKVHALEGAKSHVCSDTLLGSMLGLLLQLWH